MRLYLVQHGEAKPKTEDPERPLTKRGHDDVWRVAGLIRAAGVTVHEIRHSGKLRAEETASILAECLTPAGGLTAQPGLLPDDDVHPAAEWLKRETHSLMLVSHGPFLERLAGLLLAGDPANRPVRFRTGGIVCLERDVSSGWSVAWAVTPDLAP